MIQTQGADGPVKIGLTAGDVMVRLRALQTSMPWDLRLIRSIPGQRILEQALHHYFAEQHIAREWFAYDARMLTIDPGEVLPLYRATVHRYQQRRLPTHIPIRTYGEMTVIGDLKHLLRD